MSAPGYSSMDQLSRLAELYGPFFFAILFLFFVTHSSYNYYMKIRACTNPKASQEELLLMRRNFISSVVVSLLLVFASIGWWFYQQTRGVYTYQIAITGLNARIQIDSPYFLRRSMRPSSYSEPISDDYFLVVSDHPFQPGQTFEFQVWVLPEEPPVNATPDAACTTGGLKPESVPITVHYRGLPVDAFAVLLQDDKPKLVPMADAGTSPTINGVVTPRLAQVDFKGALR
jgi:hypothetical protein